MFCSIKIHEIWAKFMKENDIRDLYQSSKWVFEGHENQISTEQKYLLNMNGAKFNFGPFIFSKYFCSVLIWPS